MRIPTGADLNRHLDSGESLVFALLDRLGVRAPHRSAASLCWRDRAHPQRAYLDLQKLARDQGRNTQQLFELYIHERFLARLAESRFADKLVLRGGMLLAVLDVRRRDARRRHARARPGQRRA